MGIVRIETKEKQLFKHKHALVDPEAVTDTLAEGWVDERDKAILDTIYYCESCNMVLEPGDTDIERRLVAAGERFMTGFMQQKSLLRLRLFFWHELKDLVRFPYCDKQSFHGQLLYFRLFRYRWGSSQT